MLLLPLKMLAMEKPGLIQAYKNWEVARAAAHFTQPKLYSPHEMSSCPSKYIPLKDLHSELDRKMRAHFLMQYVVTPVVGITSFVALGMLAYKNLKYYS